MKNLDKNWLEWSVFAVSLVLVVSTLGYLVYYATTLGDAPPIIAIQLGTPQRRSNHFVVPVSVSNHGDQTAEGVTVEVVLENGGKEQERGEFQVPFLPRHATRKGWVPFETDPRAVEQMNVGVVGYAKP